MTIILLFLISSFLLTNKSYTIIMIIIIIINNQTMSNIIQFQTFKNNSNQNESNEVSKANRLYHDLINSGFSSCAAYHEVMKLLLISNPELELSELSQKAFEIINPEFDNYYENSIDNHSQN